MRVLFYSAMSIAVCAAPLVDQVGTDGVELDQINADDQYRNFAKSALAKSRWKSAGNKVKNVNRVKGKGGGKA